MINTAPPASNSLFQVFGRLKNGFDITKLISQIMCVIVVQNMVKELFTRADKPGSTPGDAVFCFFVFVLFFLFSGLCFLTLFFLLACFPLFLLQTLLIILINIYFSLKSGVLFWKRDFKSSCILAKLTTRKSTHSTPQTVLIYTQHQPVTHWRNLNLPLVHRHNHQYYYPKIFTGFGHKK